VFLAPSKTGKSFWLQEIVHRALLGRLHVAYYQVGDMTETEIGLRLVTRASKIPFEGTVPFTLDVPIKLKRPVIETELPTIEYQNPKPNIAKLLDGETAWANLQSIKKQIGSNRKLLRLKCYPNDSATWRDIYDDLKMLSAEGFPPDIVVLDYIDLL